MNESSELQRVEREAMPRQHDTNNGKCEEMNDVR